MQKRLEGLSLKLTQWRAHAPSCYIHISTVLFWEAAILKISILATSSSGNSLFIGTASTRILIDAGISAKETFAKLEAIGEDPRSLDAIVVTHEHSDHVCGLAVIMKKLNAWNKRPLPVYASELTASQIEWTAEARVERFPAGSAFTIGELRLQSFTVPHDSIDPCGFTVAAPSRGVKVGVAMDLGYIPENVRYHLDGCEWVLLESNHDLEMLKVGPYPWSLKQRVMGRKGHLSNDALADFLLESFDGRAGTLVLGHLSEHNNHPELARICAQQALGRRGARTRLVVAEPRKQSELFTF